MKRIFKNMHKPGKYNVKIGGRITSTHSSLEDAFRSYGTFGYDPVSPYAAIEKADGTEFDDAENEKAKKLEVITFIEWDKQRDKEMRTKAVAGINEVFAQAGAKPLDEQQTRGFTDRPLQITLRTLPGRLHRTALRV